MIAIAHDPVAQACSRKVCALLAAMQKKTSRWQWWMNAALQSIGDQSL